MKTLAPAIRAHRLARLETQEEYAAFLNVSRAAVAAWEAGIRTPSFAMAKVLIEKGVNKQIVIAAVSERAGGVAA